MKYTTIAEPLGLTEGSDPGALPTITMGSAKLPAITQADSKVIHHLAALMYSEVIRRNEWAADLLPESRFLKEPKVVVYSTRVQPPLFRHEIETVAIATGHPAILLRRMANGSSYHLSADIALSDHADLKWFLDYRLFRGLAGDSWLVSRGTGPSIHLMQHGLFVTEHAPYADDWDRGAGIDRASAHLASLRIGGWSC